MLPKHDGFEVCQAIREFSDMPVIMLTAKGDVYKRQSYMYGIIQKSTITRPARLVKNACSSLPLCLRTWQMTDTSIPTAAILKMRFTSIVSHL